MKIIPEVVALNVSPSLKIFDDRLLRYLSKHMTVAQWEYCQNQDEPSDLNVALMLLHDYLKFRDRPVHLVGHGIAGLLGLLYARRHPERIRSLTLLAVGANPAADWQARYYAQRNFLPCSRYVILSQMVYHLFGRQERQMVNHLVRTLERDLDSSPSPHSLFKIVSLPPAEAPVPLLVCASKNDSIVFTNEIEGWQRYLKPCDRLWFCEGGGHFFHYFEPKQVGDRILNFWQRINLQSQYLLPVSL
ncbi:MAG: alpha/beta hydrolase [Oscillatoria sp. SIO1A7]|nr:alpha/beta hydrolase [Oscillatoria sp. SIO1A7]